MSIKAHTTAGASRRCYKAIKVVLCLSCILVCFIGLIPTTGAVDSDFPDMMMTPLSLVTLSAHPDGRDRISFTNPVWATLGEIENPDESQDTFTKQVDYTVYSTEVDGALEYFFGFDNPVTLSGYFCINPGNALSFLADYEGGDWWATYNGYLYQAYLDEGYIEQIGTEKITGEVALNIGEYTDITYNTMGVTLPGDYNFLEARLYFVGEIEIVLETYGDVTFGLRDTMYIGDNLSPLFHTSETLDYVERPPKLVTGNATYRTAWIADGTLYYTPSVRVNVMAESHTHSWLLQSIEPVFNTPIFDNGFTIGTLCVILVVIGLLALILKLAFGG